MCLLCETARRRQRLAEAPQWTGAPLVGNAAEQAGMPLPLLFTAAAAVAAVPPPLPPQIVSLEPAGRQAAI